MNDDRLRLLRKLVQYAVGLVALVWLVEQIKWGRVVGMAKQVEPSVIGVILALTVFETLCRFSMWHVLLNGLRRTPFMDAARANLVVNFVNQVIPSRVSGRSLSPVVLRHYTGYPWSEVVTVAGLHTALYALLNGAVALVGLLLFAPAFSPGLVVVLGLSTALYLVVGPVILLAGRRLDLTAGVVGRVLDRFIGVPYIGTAVGRLSGNVPQFTTDAADTFQRLSANPRAVVPYAAGWAVTLMVVPGIRTWLLLDALGVTFSPALLLPVVLVTAYTVTLLPLTPGGVGVAEATATLVFVALGVPAVVIAPVILVDRFLGVYLPALLGWYPTARLDPSVLSTRTSR